LKLDKKAVHNALSLAAIQAGGIHEISESGQSSKPMSPAKAASGGVLAARLAQSGVEGPLLPLEGEKGFLKAFTDKFDFEVLQKDLGRSFAITTCYAKLYPACRHTHGAIDAAISLNKILDRSVEQIAKVKIYTYSAAIKITGSIFAPVSKDEAKFSLPYAVATGLLKGKFGLEHLEVGRSFDSKVRELVSKIEIITDPTMEDRAANIRGAKVQVLLQDGSSKEVVVKLPKGDPEVPVSQGDIENKLRLCSEGLIPADRQQALIEAVWELEKMPELSLLLTLCGRSPQTRAISNTVTG
jgi:2-methylcitrate dehydratase PrpD